ncbi:unnamed protein product [Chironomus riparius]|uniref:Major facilitator superfamily (MFS) profile domain-containing protein n=1 Tax=Chironomus riparius TaxID=315576 RepID=A0A9N9WQ00_9DIPT|nr:unnamed protein product [Chironomus riparius]
MVKEEHKDWDEVKKGIILTSYYYGHLFTQIAGGMMVSKIPDFIVFGSGVLLTSILTLVSPVSLKANFETFVTLRVIMGLIEGYTMPSMYQIWSKWAPPFERTRMCGLQYAGHYIGIMMSMCTCGIIADSFGWQTVFYIYGGIACLWSVIWLGLVRGSPDNDYFISDEEKEYIAASLTDIEELPKQKSFPFKAILTSGPFWAIVVAHFAENWGLFTMLTQLPSFLKDYNDYSISDTGFVASIPYLVFGVALLLAGIPTDYLQEKETLTTTQIRRFFSCFAFLAQGIFIMTAAYMPNSMVLIAFISLGAGFGALSTCGYALNHLDIAPQYASFIKGISNAIGTLPAIFAPMTASFLVKDKKNLSQWKNVFIITAHIYFAGCIIYWFFASGEIQPWAKEVVQENIEVSTVSKSGKKSTKENAKKPRNKNENDVEKVERQAPKIRKAGKKKSKYRQITTNETKLSKFYDRVTTYFSKIFKF